MPDCFPLGIPSPAGLSDIAFRLSGVAIETPPHTSCENSIIDENNIIYQVGNVWFKLDFNRAEDYNKLEKGKKYKIEGYGIRVPMIDMYKKIITILNSY